MAYKHITYMGAYSLKTWIRKILEREIELPPYQRDFVWNEEDGKKLKESLEKGYYIPPVTLAKYKDDDDNKKKTYLLDGQQRLTSIICLYLGVWPTKNKPQDSRENEEEFFSKFTFKVLQDLEPNDVKNLLEEPDKFQEILGERAKYLEKKRELKIEYKDIERIFLPYCLIVPNFNNAERREEKKFLAETFIAINKLGKKVIHKELRESIFWIYKNSERDNFKQDIEKFEKEKLKRDIDFLGQLAIVCDFKTREDNTLLKYNLGNRFEKYVNDFILCYCGEKGYGRIWSQENIEKIKNNHKRFRQCEEVFLKFLKENENLNNSQAKICVLAFILYIYFTDNECSKMRELLEKIKENKSLKQEELKKRKSVIDILEQLKKMAEQYNG